MAGGMGKELWGNHVRSAKGKTAIKAWKLSAKNASSVELLRQGGKENDEGVNANTRSKLQGRRRTPCGGRGGEKVRAKRSSSTIASIGVLRSVPTVVGGKKGKKKNHVRKSGRRVGAVTPKANTRRAERDLPSQLPARSSEKKNLTKGGGGGNAKGGKNPMSAGTIMRAAPDDAAI